MNKILILSMMCIGLFLTIGSVNAIWCDTDYVNSRNITITNSTFIPANYSVVVSPNVSLGNVCGIKMVNSNCDVVLFGYQDNGNTTFESNENITFRVDLPTSDYQIYYNQNTPSCLNSSFSDVRFDSFSGGEWSGNKNCLNNDHSPPEKLSNLT